jgi:hypothetical protein
MPIPIKIRILQNDADSSEAFGVPVIQNFLARILLARNFLTRIPDPVFAPYPDDLKTTNKIKAERFATNYV